MRCFETCDVGRRQLGRLSFQQMRQAAAVMDGLGRLIPQEGVDYEVNITFKGANSPSVSMEIIPLTDKGEFWKAYVSDMIQKYPPVADYKGEPIPDNPVPPKKEGEKQRKGKTK